ncbi:MAG: EamA family transporter [Betaproteobacteria bacterium]|nr:EamA family transporter [Betaproteobacteria bacterium]
MLLGGLAFATMGMFAKLGAAHFTSVELVFYRSVVGTLSLGLLARTRGWTIATPHWRLHLTRGIFGVISLGLYFYCIGRLPLATAVTLNYTSPLFLALFTTVLLREAFHAPLVVALCVSFAGVMLLLQPAMQEDRTFEVLLGLASGMLAAGAYLNVKKLGATGEPSWRVVFYFTLLSTCLAAIGMALTGAHALRWDNVWIVAGIGVSATVGQFAMTRAYHSGHALVVGALSYSTVVFSALLALAVWREIPGIGGWAGMGLIVVGGLLSLRAGRRRTAKVSAQSDTLRPIGTPPPQTGRSPTDTGRSDNGT